MQNKNKTHKSLRANHERGQFTEYGEVHYIYNQTV